MDAIERKTLTWTQGQSTAAGQQAVVASVQAEGPRYTPTDKLGEGGMGSVYQVADHDLNRQVALKILHVELVANQEAVQRFVREAQAEGKLDHPGIPHVHEVGFSTEGVPYFTMKLVRGETLETIIARLREGDPDYHRRFNFTIRAQIMQTLCDAIHYAHEQGVVHRDIKPQNVMVGQFGEIQLMDWGACYDHNPTGERAPEPDFMGTPNYSSPERFDDPATSLRPESDIWSLGVLMFELFTLRMAFPDTDVLQIIEKVRKAELPPADVLSAPVQGRCPKEFALVIRTATARLPAFRYRSAAEMRKAIAAALHGDIPVVCPCTGAKRTLTWMDRMIDRWGGLAVFFALLWGLLPVFMLLWIVFTRP